MCFPFGVSDGGELEPQMGKKIQLVPWGDKGGDREVHVLLLPLVARCTSGLMKCNFRNVLTCINIINTSLALAHLWKISSA